MTRLLCAISDHGFGHLAQAAPILNALHTSHPELEFLIWSGLPRNVLQGRLNMPFSHRQASADIGMRMHDAMQVDIAASLGAYQQFHAQWDSRLAHEAHWMKAENVDAVFSNVAYLPLAAAAKAEIPAIAACSLNWYDIAKNYLPDNADTRRIFQQMRSAYASAKAFMRLTPALPMAWMNNIEDITPVATTGRGQRTALIKRLGLSKATKLVLIGFGGIEYSLASGLPVSSSVAWLVPDDWTVEGRSDVIGYSRTDLNFPDLLASCDALITKVGYGSFVEAAAQALPVLYLERPDWPESPWLEPWLQEHTRALPIQAADMHQPEILELLATLWGKPAKPPIQITGVHQACRRAQVILGL